MDFLEAVEQGDKEAVDSLFPEIFKTWLEMTLSS